MKVSVKKHTGIEEARRAIEATCHGEMHSKAELFQIYTWLHSPIRTQLFEITLEDIPTFVATHLVRHVTTQPFVSTRRNDRGAKEVADRYTPVDMIIWANAESLMSMAGKRLCYQSSVETRTTMQTIKLEILKIDKAIGDHMQPNCVYQGGYCREPKICGRYQVKRYNPINIMKRINT